MRHPRFASARCPGCGQVGTIRMAGGTTARKDKTKRSRWKCTACGRRGATAQDSDTPSGNANRRVKFSELG